jgi:hypothetical protein
MIYSVLVFFEPVIVEPEGFEPSSKHGISKAFYMLSCYLIVGIKEG